MSVPAEKLSFPSSNSKQRKNTMLLSGRIASIDDHGGELSGRREVFVYRVQLPSPDGFSAGARVPFITERKNAYRLGDSFEEFVILSNFYRRYEQNGEIKRSQFSDVCFVLDTDS